VSVAALAAKIAAGSIVSGRCRYCRCTEDNPCRLPEGDACSWFDRSRTVCTNPACLTAIFAAQYREKEQAARAQAQARRRRTPGEVAALIVAEKKQKRQAANAKYRARMKVQKVEQAPPGSDTGCVA
jgi:hypothetical protein